MNKKFYNLGFSLLSRNKKCVGFWEGAGAAVLSGGASLLEGLFGAGANAAANRQAAEIAQAQLDQQAILFQRGNEFNHNEAELARQFNAEEALKNRAFQAGMLDKSIREYENYNNASSQVARHLAAGLNPAALAGNLNTTQGFSVPSGSAASGVAASAAAAPQVSGYTPRPVNPLEGVTEAAANAYNSYMNARKNVEETQGIMTENKFKEQVIKKGLALSDAQINESYAHATALIEDSNLTRKKIDQVASTISNLEAQTDLFKSQKGVVDVDKQIKDYQAFYANDYFKYQAKNIEEQYHYNKGLADTIVAYTWAKIAEAQGSAASAYANAKYQLAYSKLAPYEQEQMDAATEYIETQNDNAKYDLFLNRQFGWKKRFYEIEGLKADIDLKKEQTDRVSYENTDTYRIIQGVKDVAVGAGAAAGTAYGVSRGIRGTQKNFIYGNPRFKYNYSYSY